MIELIVIIVVLLVGWLWVKFLARDVSIAQARTRGLQAVKAHLKEPVLLEDYAKASKLSKEEVYVLVHRGKLPSYKWHQHIFVDAAGDDS